MADSKLSEQKEKHLKANLKPASHKEFLHKWKDISRICLEIPQLLLINLTKNY